MPSHDRSLRNSVCLNHPERPATARCTVCFKPICGECAKGMGDAVCCSDACLENYERTRGTIGAWHDQRQREIAQRRRRTLIRLVILLILAIAAYLYFSRNPRTLDQLKDSAGRTVRDVKQGLGR